jgi:hypothetical protein
MIFNNPVHQTIWVEHHCHRCWQYPDCRILERAIRTDRKPVEWERNRRKNVLMQDSIKCNEESRLPPPSSRPVVDENVPMFDVTPTGRMDSEHA